MIKCLLTVALSLAATSAGANEIVVLGSKTDHLVMRQVPRANATEDLIGGIPVGADEYPSVFYTTQDDKRCTGTLVASRVIASAAQCISSSGAITLDYKGQAYSGICAISRHYATDTTADWALCLLDRPIPDAIAESVLTNRKLLAIGKKLTLLGYGCIYRGGRGDPDGTLRAGQAPITALPSATSNDTVTKGRVALCYGDSGGPSFVTDPATGFRYQVAVNSRGDLEELSHLSSLYTPKAVDFYEKWAELNKVRICGLHADAKGCWITAAREAELPEACQVVQRGDALETLDACALDQTPPARESCAAALNEVKACLDARP